MQIPSLQIAIILDKSGSIPVVRITDTTPYGGLETGITGTISILQPDGMGYAGNFTNPDIYYINGTLLVAQKELRLAGDGNFQKGPYVVTYTARRAGYDDTTITQSFTIDYARPKGVITPNIDVFTPSLKANDTTNYVADGFSLQSVVRSWISDSDAGMTIGGDVTQFDLNILGHYYDSIYNIDLTAVITYLLTDNQNVSIIDKLGVAAEITTVIPQSLNTLFAAITAYKLAMGSVGGTCKDDYLAKKENYRYAYALFMHYIHLGTCGSNPNILVSLYNELLATLNNGATVPHTQTNTIIPAYNFGSFCGIGDTSLPLLITSQPSDQAKTVGQSLTLTVAASGTPALTYQWRKNGTNIGGATSASYNIPSVILGDAAAYDVVVTDGLSNSITSNTANVTVNTAPSTFTAYWGWTDADPFTALQTADGLTYQGSGTFNHNSAVVADFRTAPELQFLVLKVPVAEPVKTIWNNTGLNNGDIPDDFIWHPPFVTGGFRYYVTRQALTLDINSTTTFS